MKLRENDLQREGRLEFPIVRRHKGLTIARRGRGTLFDGSPIMSFIADMILMSFKGDMYFIEDIHYDVRHEGHTVAQP